LAKFYFSLRGEIFCFFLGSGKAYSFASFGLCLGLCELQMCMALSVGK